METSDVKRRVVETIESAKRQAAERRTRTDEASRVYALFLDRTAIPLLKQIANVLRAQGINFTVFTPSGSVRLMSDRSSEDYIELTLDTSGDEPLVSGHVSRSRGRRVLESERPLGSPDGLTEDDVLTFVLKELTPMVER
jgi:hypothetical protein